VLSTVPRPPAQPIPEPAIRPEEGAGSRLIVGPNIKLKGVEIDDCDTLVVEGRVEATMVSRALQIAEGGSFRGNVDIEVAEIRGAFDGELTVRGRLVVHATGRINGKVRYGKLLVQEGGEVCGDVGTLADKAALAR
jgi:cytoskeletal protein CcmA (bactofilin family)